MNAAAWILTVGIIACEILLPLSFCFWLGRRYERRQVERAVVDGAAEWLDTHDRRPSLEA